MSADLEAAISAAVRAVRSCAKAPANTCAWPACACVDTPGIALDAKKACEAHLRATPPTPQPAGMTAAERAALLEVLDYLARPEPASQSERDKIAAFAAAIRKESPDA